MTKLVLTCTLLFALVPSLWPQESPATKTDAQPPTSAPGPYDRLELLASIFANMDSAYLASEIRDRGLDFIADQRLLNAILAAHASTSVIGLVEDAKPRAKHAPLNDRLKAYEILVDVGRDNRGAGANSKYQDAIVLAPDSAALHLAFAAHLLLVPDYRLAETEARHSIRLWAGSADAHCILATALIGQDEPDAAVFEARQALSIYPQHRAAMISLAMALTRDRQFKEAIPILRQALARFGPSFLHKDLGVALYNTGDIEGAISEYATFLQASPNDADGHYQLGVALRAQGHTDEAQAQFRECARIDPSQLICAAIADPSAAAKAPGPGAQRPDDGSVDRNIYTNRFFGFSFQFPENWTSLSPDDAKAAARFGAGLIAGGDQTIEDAAKAGGAYAYPLLFVTPDRTHGLSSKSVQIQALDSRIAPQMASGKDFLEGSARMLGRLHSLVQSSAPVSSMSVNGKQFWRLDLAMLVDNSVRYGSEIVTIQDGFVLLFVFSSPDKPGLDELMQSMNSLHFFASSNSN